MTDVRRMMKLQEERDSVMSLSRSGALPEEMLVDFKAAEKELELELFEVQAEAETFKEGWSNEIVRDSARLLKIEEELLDIKRRKEQHERKKIDDEQAAKDATRVQRQPQLGEEEKKKLLEELLEGEAQDSNSKVRKRNSGGSGKK
jgi:translocation protein SEC66